MKTPQELPSDRSFGLTFGVVFALIGAAGLWKGSARAVIAFAVSAASFALALLAPRVLHRLNIVWMRFGAILNTIVSPVMLAVIFYGVVTPYGAILRLAGRDVLRRRFEPSQGSYWITRDPRSPDASAGFRRQF